MEDYYEILEISKKASPEIIEKAYKVLAKKYHPDVQEEENKAWAEEKFKNINKAYETLSDEEKRKEYDALLEDEENETYQELMQEILVLRKELKKYTEKEQEENIYNDTQTNYNTNTANIEYNQENIYNQYNPNNQNQNDYTYKEQYTTKEDWLQTKLKGLLSIILTIIIVIFVAYILWVIPFTHNWLQNLYQENEGIRTIVDIFIK